MKIKYYTESAYLDVYDAVPDNLEKYTLSTNDWIFEKYEGKKYCKESLIDASLPNLDDKMEEYANVIAVYNALKDKLSPSQASNPYLWSYLTHFEYWEYTSKRWIEGKDPSESTIKDRFFCKTESGSRIGLLRNALSRLWWIGYLTYDESASNPYALTQIASSHSDLLVSVIERNFSMNRNVTMGILSAIKEINDDPTLKNVGLGGNGEYEWRSACKFLNRYGAVTLLDSLSRDEIKTIIYDYILKNRN